MMESTEFRRLYDTYYSDVLRFVGSLLSFQTNQADVDDIVQNVFIKVALKAQQFRGEANWKTWLFAIARNTVIDYQRQAARQAARTGPSLSDEVFMNGRLTPSLSTESFGNFDFRHPSPIVERSSLLGESDTSGNPEASAIGAEEQAEVRACIDELSLSMRAVIVCRLQADLSIRETAAIMNWSQGRVRVTYSRALRKFKEIWERRYI